MKDVGLDDDTTQRLLSRLVAQKRRLTRAMDRMWQSGLEDAETGGIGELSLYDQHPADLGSELAARQTDLGLQQNIDRLLDQVERALKRIDEGTYGTCERCGRPIGKERLEAVPYATMCIACQEEVDGPATKTPRPSDAIPGGGVGGVHRTEATHHYGEHVPGRSDRPIEETALEPPFGRTFRDGDDYAAYDGEDAWQDVARYGTSNTPSDVPGAVGMGDVYIDADEAVGIVEPVESVIDIGGRGVTEADIFPEPDHERQLRYTRPGGVGADGMSLGVIDSNEADDDSDSDSDSDSNSDSHSADSAKSAKSASPDTNDFDADGHAPGRDGGQR